MRWTNNSIFAAAMAATLSVVAIAGQAPVAKTVKGGESGLVGIKLYDSGTRIISVYGNPSEIQPVSFGGSGIGPAGGGGGGVGPAGGPGGPGGPRAAGAAGGGGGGSAAAPNDAFNGPGGFGFGDDILLQKGGMGPAIGAPGGGSQAGPIPGAPPGAGPAGDRGGLGGPGGGGNMGGSTGGKILYTRWIYRRGPSKYGFILDKFNRVVQVEAIGMNDGRVRTSKGIKFGSTFGDVMKKYQTPDGYEINGDNIVLRYLVRNKVAFRLSRLAEKKPHVVTGIVVAGGKT